MTVRKAYSSGLSFEGNYTYSKALDDVSDLFLNGAAARPTDNMNHKADYGPADFNTPHRVVARVSYELPFMKGNRWLGGWGTNSIVSWQSGHPFTVFRATGRDLNKDGYRTDRSVPVNGVASAYKPGGSPTTGILDAAAFDWAPDDPSDPTTIGIQDFNCPASVNSGLWCDSPTGRNAYVGPQGTNVDFNITKKFKVTESSAVTFQANFFDLFNHPNFLNPTAGSSGSTNLDNADFSQSRATWGDSGGHRVVQLALRFDF
jgi:hypothetical protein